MCAKKKEVKVTDHEQDESTESKSLEEETVESEPDDSGTTEESVEPELSDEEIQRLRLEETEDRLLRTVAEFDNYKKRTARQYQLMVQSANERILLSLLEVVDNFDRALEHSDEAVDNSAILDGMKLIYEQVKSLLEKYEISPIEAVGQPFDPNLHEALMQVDSDEVPEGTVAMEMARGYKIGERVLRHSKVGVSTGKKSDSDESE